MSAPLMQYPGMPEGLVMPPPSPPQSTSIFDILSIKEIPFYYLGLSSPMSRLLFGIVVSSGLIYAIKPSFAFRYDDPRPFIPFSNVKSGGTWVPWWVPGIVVGTVLALYI